MQFIFIILFIDIDYCDLYLFLLYKPLSIYALKENNLWRFHCPANFIILIFLEIISYLCVLFAIAIPWYVLSLWKRPALLVFKFPVVILVSEKIKYLMTICSMEFSLLNMENMWDQKKWN